MSDFEKKVGIIEVDVDYSASKKAVTEFTESIIVQKDTIAKNNNEIRQLGKENAALEKAVKKGNLTFDEANKEIEANTKRVTNLKKENAFLGDEIKDLNKERTNAVKATKLQSNSLDTLKKKVRDQKKELGGLNIETKEGRKRFGELKNEIKGNVGQINDLEKGTGGFRDTLSSMPTPLSGIASGIQGMTKAALAFLATPLGIVIGALSLVLAPLINYLTTTQAGIDKVTSVTRPLFAVFEKLKGLVQELGGSVFKGLAQILNGDLKAGFETLKNGVIDSVGGISEAVREGVKAGTEIDNLTKKIERSEINLITQRAKLNNEYERSKEIAMDQSKTEAERLAGAKAAQKAQNDLLTIEQELINDKIKLKELEHALNDTTREDEKELANLVAERTNFEAQASKKRSSAKSLENSILKQQTAINEKLKKQAEAEEAADQKKIEAETAKQKAANDLRVAREKELADKLIALEDFRRNQSNKTRVSEIEDISKQLEERRAIAMEDFELEMERLEEQKEIQNENDTLSKEEKLIKEAEFDLQIEQMRAQHKENMNALDEEQKNETLRIEKEKQQSANQIQQTGHKAIQSGVQIANNRISSFYNKRFADLRKQYESGAITEEEYAKRKEALSKQETISAWKAQRAQFRIEKGIALTKASIALGEAIFKSAAFSPLTAGQPWASINAAIIGAQIGQIATRKAPARPSFAQGGDVMSFMVGGNRHSSGGTNYVGEDGNSFNVEKGEGIFVTKREATNPALAALDEANTSNGGRSMFGSSSRFLQEGGSVSQSAPSITPEALVEAMKQAPPPVVGIETVMGGILANEDAKKVGMI